MEQDEGASQTSGGSAALLAGLVGAVTVTVINEFARRRVPDAPRLETLGMRGIALVFRQIDRDPPSGDRLFWLAMAGDLVSNTLYYSLVGKGGNQGTWRRGALLGLAAGAGAAWLPGPLGLGRGPTERTPATQAMAVAWYLAGGLAASAAATRLTQNEESP